MYYTSQEFIKSFALLQKPRVCVSIKMNKSCVFAFLSIGIFLTVIRAVECHQINNTEYSNRTKSSVRLCCGYGQIYESNSCTEYFPFNLVMESGENKVPLSEYFGFEFGKPCEKLKEKDPRSEKDVWRLFFNGSVKLYDRIINQSEYCLLAKRPENRTFENLSIRLAICVYGENEQERLTNMTFMQILIPYLMLLSVPFLIATFCVYASLPELQGIPTKCLLCYIFGLVISYTMMATVQLDGSNGVTPIFCKMLAIITYFFIMSTFFWLNVISFDLWHNFNDFKRSIRSRPDAKNPFPKYFLYAYGSSFAITSFACTMDNFLGSTAVNFQPGFGENRCHMKAEDLSEFLYLYLPVAVLTCLNIVFFILVARRIQEAQRDLKAVRFFEQNLLSRNDLNRVKDKFAIFVRLFVMTGVPWFMEPISRYTCVFLLNTVCNAMQGVFIFILFVCKRKIFRLIRKRFNRC